MEGIRLATPAEIEAIKGVSDLTPQSTVFAFPNGDKTADFGVLRHVVELDPVIYAPESTTKRKALFVWAIENGLRMMGVPEYYFNVNAMDEPWIEAIESWGANKISKSPEFRFKKRL